MRRRIVEGWPFTLEEDAKKFWITAPAILKRWESYYRNYRRTLSLQPHCIGASSLPCRPPKSTAAFRLIRK